MTDIMKEGRKEGEEEGDTDWGPLPVLYSPSSFHCLCLCFCLEMISGV